MKWYGRVGFAMTTSHDGIWEDEIVEKKYTGDLLQNRVQFQNSGNVNDNINLNNRISIIANKFVYDNFECIKYVEVLGKMWKVESVEIQYPRLILTIGGLWNGEQEST